MIPSRLAALSLLLGVVAAYGCGKEESATETSQGNGGGGGVGGASGSGDQGGQGGSGDQGGSDGQGGGAASCEPNVTEPCYGGPAGTEGVGVCKGGTRTCNPQGTGFGLCEGEVLPSQEDCTTSEDEDCDGATPTCGSDNLWSRRFGTGEGLGLITGSGGHPIFVGRFPGTLSFGGNTFTSSGGYDGFIAKLDGASGEHIWSRRLGGAEDQAVWSVAEDPQGNIVVIGEFLGQMSVGGGNTLQSEGGYDVFVAKYDGTDGDHLWSRRFGNSEDQVARGVAVTKTGEILVTGSFSGGVDFGTGLLESEGSFDVFVLTLDSSGKPVRAQRYGDGEEQNGRAIAVDAGGNAVITGDFRGSMTFGETKLTSAGGFDLFVAKLDPTGGVSYARRFGDMDPQRGYAVRMNAMGNAVVSGIVRGTVDFGGNALTAQNLDVFLLELSPSGGHVRSFLMGGSKADSAGGVAIGAGGRYIVGGGFVKDANFGGISLNAQGGASSSDAFVARYDTSGSVISATPFGDKDDQIITAITTDAAGRIFVTAQTSGVVDFGQGPLSGGAADLALAKLAP
ncbi:hypothetical protein [Polyangium mundeleinium]|uniref:Cell surface protein n=1 Tax=Polyangium mundeleinium TaxID=2995306 RepID=A0ABT5EW97_9BACT|nr:hypothetical protein [Polyangium mundeleinium]MDC0745704.1 hypothetical protein [Polyangium mundeleinium]